MPRQNWQLLVAVVLISLVCYARARSINRVEYGRMQQAFTQALHYIEHYYVRPVNRRELFDAAMAGMVEKLDPHSAYVPPHQYTFLQETIHQEFGGVGIQVTRDEKTGVLEVVTPLVGTPAYEAGLMPGDQILAIDGRDVVGATLEQAVQLMRGPPGKPVRLKLRRPSEKREFEKVIVRQVIRVPTVLGDRYDLQGNWVFTLQPYPHIGYIRIVSFSQRTVEELRHALQECQKAQIKGLILDLRYNPGGLFDAAVGVCDLFLEQGLIVTTRYRALEDQEFRATPGAFPPWPMAVLVNQYSASASEIVAACLQDHGRAVIVGERTFGKGSVQQVFPLEGERSALKLTIGTYHRPSGANIHREPDMDEDDTWGVRPDPGYEVPLEGEELQRALQWRRKRDVFPRQEQEDPLYLDPQLRRAVEAIEKQLSSDSKASQAVLSNAAVCVG